MRAVVASQGTRLSMSRVTALTAAARARARAARWTRQAGTFPRSTRQWMRHAAATWDGQTLSCSAWAIASPRSEGTWSRCTPRRCATRITACVARPTVATSHAIATSGPTAAPAATSAATATAPSAPASAACVETRGPFAARRALVPQTRELVVHPLGGARQRPAEPDAVAASRSREHRSGRMRRMDDEAVGAMQHLGGERPDARDKRGVFRPRPSEAVGGARSRTPVR